jgi:dUTP pyrophosphatase
MNKQTVRITFTNRNGKKPVSGTDYAAGVDLITHENVILGPGKTVMLDTGIALEIPEGLFGMVRPRSSAFRKGLVVQGCLDSDYRGPVKVVITNVSGQDVDLEEGRAYAQLILVPYVTPEFVVVDSLDETERGDKGFGSTGMTNLTEKNNG